MLKRLEARLWTMGAAVPMVLAACSTATPTATPLAQPGKANFAVQGGYEQKAEPYQEPAPVAAPVPYPCVECPPQVFVDVAPFALVTFDWLSSHPILDYSWYFARGNFAVFGWGPQFLADYSDFLYYPTAYGYWPYAMDAAVGAYVPYATAFGFPFIGFSGDPYLWGGYYGAGLNIAWGSGLGYGLPPAFAGGGVPVDGGMPGPDAGAYGGHGGDYGGYMNGGKKGGEQAETYTRTDKKDRRNGNGGGAYSQNGRGNGQMMGQQRGGSGY